MFRLFRFLLQGLEGDGKVRVDGRGNSSGPLSDRSSMLGSEIKDKSLLFPHTSTWRDGERGGRKIEGSE